MVSSALHQLEQIPVLGKNIARDTLNIGIDDLKRKQAEQLYDRLCEFKASCFRLSYKIHS